MSAVLLAFAAWVSKFDELVICPTLPGAEAMSFMASV
jgi:hypothetical protein